MVVASTLSRKNLPRSEWSMELPNSASQTQSSVVLTNEKEMDDEIDGIRTTDQSSRPGRVFPLLTFLVGLLLAGVVAAVALSLWLIPPKTTTITTTTSTTTSSTSTSTTSTTSTTSETTTTATTTTTTVTRTTTTIITPAVNALWSFDGNTNDKYGIYNAVPVNGPTYVTGYTNQSGTALFFDASASQYVIMSSSFVDLTSKSFTVEMWFYPIVITSADFGLFGQCQTTSQDLCLIYMIRNYRPLLAFQSDDTAGLTSISINQWYHIAFVYDYPTSTQSVYVNGFLESTRKSYPYQGTSEAIFIGAINNGPMVYSTSYIDEVSLMTRTKSAEEILMDATLVCYYSFDSNISTDSGPLGLTATNVGASMASGIGRINSAISFTSASSYLVAGGLTRLGTIGQAYSISIWVNPTSVNGGTIVHISRCNTNCNSNWCLAFIGFTSNGQIAIQSWSGALYHLVNITGPAISTNVWTHIVQTYSSTNGMRLYINGNLYGQSRAFLYSASGAPDYLYVGSYPLNICVTYGAISPGQYYGLLDEFYLFARELTASEVYQQVYP